MPILISYIYFYLPDKYSSGEEKGKKNNEVMVLPRNAMLMQEKDMQYVEGGKVSSDLKGYAIGKGIDWLLSNPVPRGYTRRPRRGRNGGSHKYR